MKLHVVLVEPKIPQNTGNVARTCAAVGADLHLVHPLGFSVNDAAVRRAGLDYWDLLTLHEYNSLASFLECRTHDDLYLFTSHGSVAHTAANYSAESYLVFGNESTGLPEDFIREGSAEVVRIPIRVEARCLNLSNAVAVGVFEVLRQWNYPGQSVANIETADGLVQPSSPGCRLTRRQLTGEGTKGGTK